MAKHRMQVNPSFRGELFLPTVNYTVKRGDYLAIDEDDINNIDIQIALKRQHIIDLSVKNIAKKEEEVPANSVKLSNMLSRLNASNVISSSNPKEVNPTEKEPNNNINVWDAYEQKTIGKKESLKRALNQLNSVQMELAQGKVIDLGNTEETEANEVELPEIKSPKTKKARKTASKKSKKITLNDADLLPTPDFSIDDEPVKTKKIHRLSNNEEVS